jgi:hypothetical protein
VTDGAGQAGGDRLRVLVLGGYGVFGGRLAELLCEEPRLDLILAGRSMVRAEAFCARLGPGAGRSAAAVDRDGDVKAALETVRPDLVVDASGPFQAYGQDPYRVIRACLDAGIDYLDLADGSDFVEGVAAFDEEARARGISILSGVSSFPVLTAAVVRRLAAGLDRVRAISAGIAPSPFAGVGLNVIRAIASYAGKPVAVIRDGRPAVGWGMLDGRRFTVAPPGATPLDHILFSLVDTPDLKALPPLWKDLDSLWVGAGPVPEVLHRALNALAWLVKIRLLPGLSGLAPLFHWAINRFRWGEHRGGMFVRVEGTREGAPVERSWHLLAEGRDGPYIPSMAVEALVRRRLAGGRPAPGARASTGDLELEDYEALFARRTIVTGVREVSAATVRLPLYRRVLAGAWDRLPEPIRRLHDLTGPTAWAGRAEVERGRGPAAWIVAALIGAPRAGTDVPVRVEFDLKDGAEVWRRRFGGRVFLSLQAEGRGRYQHLIEERFGPLTVGLAPVVDGERLRLVVRRWTLFGIGLPRFLMPRGEAFEAVEGGRFRFHVEIRSPLTGLIVRYRGWLEPA